MILRPTEMKWPSNKILLKKVKLKTKALVSRSTHYHPYTEMAVDSRLLYLLYSVYEKSTDYGRPISFFSMFTPLGFLSRNY